VNGVFSDRSREGADRPKSVFSSSRRPIVTKDNDFLARALVRGHPPQVVQVCLGNASTRQIANLLQARLDDIERFVMESNESVFMLRE
jgi:predicted nuclease of predicted toxin-antitoxin system